MEGFQLPPELLTSLLTAIVTFIAATALNARAAASEKSLFLKMVEQQNEKLSTLEAKYMGLQVKYEYEVARGNRLEDRLRKVEAELVEVRTERDRLAARLADIERAHQIDEMKKAE